MNFKATKKILDYGLSNFDRKDAFIAILDSVIELLELQGNDFSWSHWSGVNEAVSEIRKTRDSATNDGVFNYPILKEIFAPTGSLQEVSISSGWGNVFLLLSEQADFLNNTSHENAE